MPCHGARPSRQERETVFETLANLLDAEESGMRRGELDAERYTVETAADVENHGTVGRGQFEAGMHASGTLDEEPHRV